MECALTICAVLHIPYGHGRNTNWNISISFSLHWQTTTTRVAMLTQINKCSNALQLFALETQNACCRHHDAIEKHLSTSSQSKAQGKSPKQTSLESKQYWKGSVQLYGDVLIGPSTRSLSSSLISNWGFKMDYKQHQTSVDPFLQCVCTHAMCKNQLMQT